MKVQPKIKPTLAWAFVDLYGKLWPNTVAFMRFVAEHKARDIEHVTKGTLQRILITATPTKSQRGKGRKGA